jgi:hypothetical protein
MGGWVGPRIGLYRCRKTRPPTGIRSTNLPASREYLYRLRYPVHSALRTHEYLSRCIRFSRSGNWVTGICVPLLLCLMHPGARRRRSASGSDPLIFDKTAFRTHCIRGNINASSVLQVTQQIAVVFSPYPEQCTDRLHNTVNLLTSGPTCTDIATTDTD